MKKLASALFVLFLASAIQVHADENLTPEKRENIKRLLEVTGAMKVGQLMSEAVVKQMTESIKKVRPEISSSTFDIVADEVNKTISEGMVAKGGFIDLVVPVYHKYLSNDEIKGLLSFYQTPLGKKAVTVLPAMTREAMVIGQRWGQNLGPVIEQRVKARLKQKGIEI
jgi:hypothetical protein